MYHLLEVDLRQETGDNLNTRTRSEQARIFSENIDPLNNADIVAAFIDGADTDAVTACGMGYAHV
jgi:nucleoside 2-deoxyribosyltransferase